MPATATIAGILWVLSGFSYLWVASSGHQLVAARDAQYGDQGGTAIGDLIFVLFVAVAITTFVSAYLFFSGKDTRIVLSVVAAFSLCGFFGLLLTIPAIILQWTGSSSRWLEARAEVRRIAAGGSVTPHTSEASWPAEIDQRVREVPRLVMLRTESVREVIVTLFDRVAPSLTASPTTSWKIEQPSSRKVLSGELREVAEALSGKLDADARRPDHLGFEIGIESRDECSIGYVESVRSAPSGDAASRTSYRIAFTGETFTLFGDLRQN